MAYLHLIVPIHNASEYLPAFLDSLKAQSYQGFQLVVVDDGSTDGSSSIVHDHFPEARILHGDGNFWWTKSINTGIRFSLNDAECRYVLLLNVDMVADSQYLETMIAANGESEDMILGSAIYDIAKQTKYDLGWKINWLTAGAVNNASMSHDDSRVLLEVDVVSGRGMLVPRRIIENIGFFDEARFPQYYADVAYSVKALKKGYHIYCNQKGILFSHTEATGITHFTERISLRNIWGYLTSVKSPGKLTMRWKGAIQIVPRRYLINFLFFDTVRVFIRYFTNAFRLKARSWQ